MIEYLVLGPLEVRSEGEPLGLSGARQRLLLAVLLVHAGTTVSGSRLVDAIWGHEAGDGATHALRVHVSTLRKLLEPEHDRGAPWTTIETVGDGYRLPAESLDSRLFEHLAGEGRRLLDEDDPHAASQALTRALALWRGAAYGEDLAAEMAVMAEAARLEEMKITATEDRIEADLRLGRHHEVIAELRDLVDLHPLRERLRGLLMLALYRAGRQAEALRAYRSLTRALGEELGIEPSTEIRALEERILLQDPALDAAPAPRRSNLPTPATSFVGRVDELAALHRMAARSRLVTIAGPGGAGKTRLALEAAGDAAEAFGDGVWFVPLASVRDPAVVSQAVAEALGIDQQPGRAVADTLVDRLRSASTLLILDNCEHVVDGAAELVDALLAGCPGLRTWSTSREPLGIGGESLLRVAGLARAEDPRLGPDDLLAASDAVRLFVERAAAVRDGFRLTAGNAPAVVQICDLLDGIPLAIELAAARVAILSPQQIAATLDERFELLTTGSRTADPRQRTLKGAVDWSYRLLAESEQAALRRLSVFRGTFDLEAAAHVCGPLGKGPTGLVALVASLVDKSLVSAVPGGTEVRYRLLETIRLYGRAELDAAGEEAATLARHRDWFLALAEDAAPRLHGPDQLHWLQRLEDAHDDLRAVLERAHAGGDVPTALRVAGSLAWFWFLHSHLAQGWTWLERLITLGRDAEPILRVRVLIAAAQFAWEQSRDDQAERWLREALETARAVGSRSHTAWALAYLALLGTLQRRWEQGRRLADEALELFQATGSFGGVGFAMWVRTGAEYLGMRESADPGDPGPLVETLESLLEPARQVGDRNFTGHLLWSLAIAACDGGRYDRADSYLGNALHDFRELGNESCAGHTLDEAARLALAGGAPKRAARLLAASERIRERLGIPGHSLELRSWEDCRRLVAEALTEPDLEEAWADGRAMGLDEAIRHATSGSARRGEG